MDKVTIIGGGNMGSLLAVKLSQKYNVTLFLNNEYENINVYTKEMKLYNEDTNTYITGNISNISTDLDFSIKNSNWIFITYPSFLFERLAKKLIPLLKKGQHLISIPGSGGFELAFKKALEIGCTLTGLQRVHSVARIIEQGKLVKESGVRDSLKIASIPKTFNEEASKFLSNCYDLPITIMENYLNITLINSNPILHTSRLYSIYKDYPSKKFYNSIPLFYENWDDSSSYLLVEMDKELFMIIDYLNDTGFNIINITTILEHYESKNYLEITKKIKSINSLKGLTTPAVKLDNGLYAPDFSSRYFIADYLFGLDIIIAFSELLNIKCNNLKVVSNWYHKAINDNKRFSLRDFNINCLDELKQLYFR